MNITSKLLACENEQQVTKALIDHFKDVSNINVTAIHFDSSTMMVCVEDEEGECPVLVADLPTALVSYGNLIVHGLGGVDLSIIRNVLRMA